MLPIEVRKFQAKKSQGINKSPSTKKFNFMKKNFGSRVLSVFCFVAVLACGCGGSDNEVTTASCEKYVTKFENAVTAYMNDMGDDSKCQALKSAARDILDCPSLT